MDYSVSSEESKAELPQWRIELSRRLQEIKTKRESPPGSAPETAAVKEPAAVGSSGPEASVTEPPKEPAAGEPAPPPQPPRRPRVTRPRPEPEKPPAPEISLPLFQASPAPPVADVPGPASGQRAAVESEPLRDLIDRAVAKQASASPIPGSPVPVLSAGPAELFTSFSARRTPGHSKLILLSRTLAGLVDLIIVIVCALGFIIAADRMAGIEIMDGLSVLHYGALLLATFFLYSIFFLFTATQTIGMMITDLRVVDVGNVRPGVARIAGRCGLYVLCLLLAGIGLLWACIDKDSRGLHDMGSRTKVIRISAI